MTENKYLTMDVGGSSVKFAVLTDDLQFLARGRRPVSVASREDLFAVLKQIQDEYGEGTVCTAMSIPGILDRFKGIAYTGGAFRWIKNMEYAKEVSELLGTDVTICNDAKAAAMAEIGYGALQGVRTAVAIILGTGIGGAVIINGTVHDGPHFSAGEFSSLRGDYNSTDREADRFATTNGIRGVKAAMKKFTGLDDIEAIEAFRMIKEGNEEAREAMLYFCRILCHHIYNLQVILDAERFVIGGGISNEPMFFDLLNEAADERFTGSIPRPEILPCQFLSDANLIGALYNWKEVRNRL